MFFVEEVTGEPLKLVRYEKYDLLKVAAIFFGETELLWSASKLILVKWGQYFF